MAKSIAQKIIAAHLVDGEMTPGGEIGLRIDQTLTQDATGTMLWQIILWRTNAALNCRARLT